MDAVRSRQETVRVWALPSVNVPFALNDDGQAAIPLSFGNVVASDWKLPSVYGLLLDRPATVDASAIECGDAPR